MLRQRRHMQGDGTSLQRCPASLGAVGRFGDRWLKGRTAAITQPTYCKSLRNLAIDGSQPTILTFRLALGSRSARRQSKVSAPHTSHRMLASVRLDRGPALLPCPPATATPIHSRVIVPRPPMPSFRL